VAGVVGQPAQGGLHQPEDLTQPTVVGGLGQQPGEQVVAQQDLGRRFTSTI
jgi:hypothetical protein